MSERIPATQVGAPDPESRNSPIVEELDEEFEVLAQESEDLPFCWFNGVSYQDQRYVCSGDELLRCERGSWIRMGSCDPDNP